MINTNQNIVAALNSDITLAALMGTTVPNKLIFSGDVDIVQETQASFQYPMIMISPISEVFDVLPLEARNAHFQLDIFDRTSQLEVEQIYEQVVYNLSFINTSQGGTKIWWTRPDSATYVHEGEMRIFHIRLDVVVYSYNNTLPE